MTTSVFFANLFWFLLFLNWVAEWNWREKVADFRSNYLLHAFIVLACVHLLWLLGTSNFHYALHDLQVKIPLVVVPLVILTTRPLHRRERRLVISLYAATVLVVTVVGFVRYVSMPGLPYREIVPFLSHIRFALNICLLVALLAAEAALGEVFGIRNRWLRLTACGVVSLWLFFFLLLIQSYTAIVILACLLPIGIWALERYIHNVRARNAVIFIAAATVCVLVGVLTYYIVDYYRPSTLARQPITPVTANGNTYGQCSNGVIENGSLIDSYVCYQELEREWGKLSALTLEDTTGNGYSVSSTLVRYLNSRGLTKDSLGVSQLNAHEVALVEQGVANHVYSDGNLVRRMVFRSLFEWEHYRHYGTLAGTSFGERLLLWQSGWQVFLDHPLLGVGTGDVVDACHAKLHEINSPIAETGKHFHDQFLSFLVAFGIVGLGLLLFVFARALHLRWQEPSLLKVAYLLIIVLSFVSEDTLETLAGILFCTVPMVFFHKQD